jgi:hypothetical protein
VLPWLVIRTEGRPSGARLDPLLLTRRAAAEIAIHRWDAEGVVGTPAPLDAALAEAAIDEFLGLLVPMFYKYDHFAGTGQTIFLDSGELDTGWLLTVNADTTEWQRTRTGTAADVTVRGSLSDLYLFCWGRPPAEPLDVRGDEDMLVRWQAAAAF